MIFGSDGKHFINNGKGIIRSNDGKQDIWHNGITHRSNGSSATTAGGITHFGGKSITKSGSIYYCNGHSYSLSGSILHGPGGKTWTGVHTDQEVRTIIMSNES